MTEKREEKVKQSGSRTPLPSFRSLLLSPRPFLLFLVFALLQLGGLTSCTLVPNQIDFDLDGKHARRDAEESPEDDEEAEEPPDAEDDEGVFIGDERSGLLSLSSKSTNWSFLKL